MARVCESTAFAIPSRSQAQPILLGRGNVHRLTTSEANRSIEEEVGSGYDDVASVAAGARAATRSPPASLRESLQAPARCSTSIPSSVLRFRVIAARNSGKPREGLGSGPSSASMNGSTHVIGERPYWPTTEFEHVHATGTRERDVIFGLP